MKLTIEIDLPPSMERLLIPELTDFCIETFGLKPVFEQCSVSGSLPSRDDAKQEAKKRLRGRKNVIWKAQMFASGAMWAKMKITGISDVIGNDR